MSWLAVDYNGDESVFKRKPKRINKIKKWSDIVERFVMEGKLVPGIYGYEYHETYGSLKVIKYSTKIKLPNGSIEKLIGKKITWKDEPVKIK